MSQSSRRARHLLRGFVGLAVVGVVLLAAVSGPAAAHGGDDGMHHHDGWMGTHDGWLGGGFGFLWMLLWGIVLLAVPVGLAYLVLSRRGAAESTDDDALALLRRRYAEGDIDEEEFESRRATLLAERQ